MFAAANARLHELLEGSHADWFRQQITEAVCEAIPDCVVPVGNGNDHQTWTWRHFTAAIMIGAGSREDRLRRLSTALRDDAHAASLIFQAKCDGVGARQAKLIFNAIDFDRVARHLWETVLNDR
ncbi:hypothetical protein [Caballeronia grimmiae]|uniref:Uncharacterized protein n=1 Tax=Caballeronia grimmiae TaxID=1071679 RepID=A0A069P1K6_9BURK|nr:hypothetical protein [Caballeronia grimmiae]KDR34530.1 hypothetical protein BG57_05825 [Caballeronia grimmiae]GGD61347.1 hypothetical protein GCM10010985_14260 [Caballeronia grimmiae]